MKWLLKRLGYVLMLFAVAVSAAAAKPEVPGKPAKSDFADHPATPYRGAVRLPDFDGRDKPYALFRTRIREGMKNGANFAGSIAVIEIGCGTGCRIVFAGDVATGQVHRFPLGGERNSGLSLSYRPDSRLVVAKWEDYDNDRCYEERFVWNGKSFGRIARKALGAREACETD